MTNRILPETLPALYRKHGVVPIQREYVALPARWDRWNPCACGLGIAYREASGRWPSPDAFAQTVVDALDVSLAYHEGYHHGYDGEKRCIPYNDGLAAAEDYALGYADGAAGWAAVKDLAVTNG